MVVSILSHEADSFSPAAAAGSKGVDRLSLEAGLLDPFVMGLRLRLDSVCLEDGDRDRLSNRDGFRGSGSVWSNRERFRGASSVMSVNEVWIGLMGWFVNF
jgi:hypothetical protein